MIVWQSRIGLRRTMPGQGSRYGADNAGQPFQCDVPLARGVTGMASREGLVDLCARLREASFPPPCPDLKDRPARPVDPARPTPQSGTNPADDTK